MTLELWRDEANDAEASCCSAHAVRLARSVAHRMGLPHFTLDLRAAFAAGVVAPFLADHAAGLTPNPCVRCNGDVRLDAMLAFADRLGAAELATGHYARVTRDGLLRAAADPAKDQSYMLAALAPASLARLRFPLGELRKPEVRELARAAGCPSPTSASRRTSASWPAPARARSSPATAACASGPGAIVDRAGRRVGRHRGQHPFTVGQRKGLGVAARAEPLYVLAKDGGANTVTVGPRAGARHGARRGARRGPAPPAGGGRPRQAALPREAARLPGARLARRLALELAEPVDGAAPGQAACLMRGDVVVGTARSPDAAVRGIEPCDGGASGAPPNRRAANSLTSDEIRERFLSYFAERDHQAPALGAARAAAYDPSTLLISAGYAPAQAVLPRPSSSRRTTG